MKQGDRVILLAEIQSNGGPYGEPIKENTVCTIMTYDANDTVIARYGTHETGKPKLISIPISLIREAMEEDLEKADVYDLVPSSFCPGSKYRLDSSGLSLEGVSKNDLLTIKSVRLALNENLDKIDMEHENGKKFEFTRQFVELQLTKYDENVEPMLEEKPMFEEDMKKLPRNYFLAGARMKYENEIVIFNSESDPFEDFDTYCIVEDIEGTSMKVAKHELEPITSNEFLYTIPRDQLVPRWVTPKKILIANEKVLNYPLFDQNIQPGDAITIVDVDSIECNSDNDTYEILRNDGETQIVSYYELKNFFNKIGNENVKQDDIIKHEDISIFENNKVESSEIIHHQEIIINDITINGIRFKLDGDSFEIVDGNKFSKNEIENLKEALTILSKMKVIVV